MSDMKNGFFSTRSVFGLPNALLFLLLTFFLIPFATRGARMALQKTENNVKDWLPSDFRETEELTWFAKKFLSEQFIVATWEGCTEESQRLKMFVAKLESELASTPKDANDEVALARATLQDYTLFIDDNLHVNWGGLNEKWLVDESGKYFFITPNGRLYRWDGIPGPMSVVRALQRFVGSFKLEGQFVAAFGVPGNEDNPSRFWQNPLLLTTPLFKTVETGPQVVRQLSGPGSPLFVDSNPIAGQRQALARLTGTMFGPPVPTDFGWRSDDLKHLLPDSTLKELPAVWPEIWTQVVKEAVERDYAGDLEKLRNADPVNQTIVWYEFFDRIAVNPPERQTCVVVTLTEPARRNLARVLGRGVLGQPTGRLFQIAEECGVSKPPKPPMAPPPFDLLAGAPTVVEPLIRVGGPPVDNVAIDEEGTITLVRLIGYSVAVGLLLSYLVLRSTFLMFMVFFVGGVSAVASLSLVWWGGASVDAILLTMPSLVYVLGIGGAIHIINYYREAVEEHGQENAPDRAVKHALWPSFLSAFTTAIGTFSLCTSNILPIKKFGIFAGLGVLLTLALLFLYLPSAMTIFPPSLKKFKKGGDLFSERIASFYERMALWVIGHYKWVTAVGLVFLVFTGFGLFKIQTSVQLLKMFDANSQIIRDYTWLESNFGRLVPMELVVRFPKELQAPTIDANELSVDEQRQARSKLTFLERAEAVAQIQRLLQDEFGYSGSNVIGRGMSAVTFFPEMPGPSSRFNLRRSGWNNKLLGNRDEILKSDYLSVETSDLNPDAELWRISLRLGALNNVDYGTFVGSLRSSVEPVVAAYRCRSEIMNVLVQQHSEQLKGRVLVLGCSKPKIALNGETVEQTSKLESSRPRDVRTFADTLAGLMINNSINRNDWHNPDTNSETNGDFATSDKWAEFLKLYDCVVLLNKHPAYDLDFIRANTTNLVDATRLIDESRAATTETRKAHESPVELSMHPGQMDVVYTGIVPIVYKAQRTLLDSLVDSTIWGFLLILATMACMLVPTYKLREALRFKNIAIAIGCGTVSMLPNIFPVIMVFGMMGHLGTLVDIGTMMTASVALGIAVDDTIHYLMWYRRCLRAGMDRQKAIVTTYKHVAPAMTQTAVIAGIGLCVFALSTFVPTQRFGILMLTLLMAALLGDLFFTPAILASPIGKIFSVPPADRGDLTDERDYGLVEEIATKGQPATGNPRNLSDSPPLIDIAESSDTSAVPSPKILRTNPKHSPRRI